MEIVFEFEIEFDKPAMFLSYFVMFCHCIFVGVHKAWDFCYDVRY